MGDACFCICFGRVISAEYIELHMSIKLFSGKIDTHPKLHSCYHSRRLMPNKSSISKMIKCKRSRDTAYLQRHLTLMQLALINRVHASGRLGSPSLARGAMNFEL